MGEVATAEVPIGEDQMLVLMAAMSTPVNDALLAASPKWLVVLAVRQGRG